MLEKLRCWLEEIHVEVLYFLYKQRMWFSFLRVQNLEECENELFWLFGMNGEKIGSDAFVFVSGKLGMCVDGVIQEKMNCKLVSMFVLQLHVWLNFMNTSVHYQSDQNLRMIVYIITEICAKLHNLWNSEKLEKLQGIIFNLVLLSFQIFPYDEFFWSKISEMQLHIFM